MEAESDALTRDAQNLRLVVEHSTVMHMVVASGALKRIVQELP